MEAIRILEQAIRELVIERGLLTAEDIRKHIEESEQRTFVNGSKLVARAWIDGDFRHLLLRDAKAAARQLGIEVFDYPDLKVLEKTDEVHHLIVCTLCSCYPRDILGTPPAWYKSKEYRSRLVREPRAVLAEFGTVLGNGVEIRVVDSTADLRYRGEIVTERLELPVHGAAMRLQQPEQPAENRQLNGSDPPDKIHVDLIRMKRARSREPGSG